MTREELRTEAVLRAFETLIARPGLFPHAQLVAERAIEYADALVAKLEPAKAEAPALDLLMTDDDPTNALADRVVREIQGHPAIRTEYAGVLQNAVIRALRPTVEEWSKAAKPATRRNCGACAFGDGRFCHKRHLHVWPDMSCADWSEKR